MARTIQNQVPDDCDALYSPILRLKKQLMSKAKELGSQHIMQGLVMAHYSSFLMCSLYHQMKKDITKLLEVRKLIELILEGDEFRLLAEQKSKLVSFIDNLGKELNMTFKPYLYIAMYSAHLDAEIYRYFNSNIGLYDFIDYYYVHPETVGRMKNYYDSSISVLKGLGLSPYLRETHKV